MLKEYNLNNEEIFGKFFVNIDNKRSLIWEYLIIFNDLKEDKNKIKDWSKSKNVKIIFLENDNVIVASKEDNHKYVYIFTKREHRDFRIKHIFEIENKEDLEELFDKYGTRI